MENRLFEINERMKSLYEAQGKSLKKLRLVLCVILWLKKRFRNEATGIGNQIIRYRQNNEQY